MGWDSFGGKWPNGDRSDIVIMRTHDSRLEIFAVGSDSALYHRWQDRPNGEWNGSSWESLGGKWRGDDKKELVVVINSDDRLEVFMVGTNKELYHRWQESPGGRWVSIKKLLNFLIAMTSKLTIRQ